MSSKHTPRPWEMMPSALEGANSKRIFADGGYLATVGASDQEWSVVVANARLIAAAPELLEACEMALVTIAGIAVKSETHRQMLQECYDRLRAAVRKATGE